MGRYLRFEYLKENEVMSEICIDRQTRKVDVVNRTSVVIFMFLGRMEPTIENVYAMLESRCFSRDRYDKNVLLEMLGLIQYDPLDICMKTHGRKINDTFWIRWEGESLKWENGDLVLI